MAEYWWSMKNNRVEEGPGDPGDDRLGPYETEEDARNWKQRAEARTKAWDDDDDKWRNG